MERIWEDLAGSQVQLPIHPGFQNLSISGPDGGILVVAPCLQLISWGEEARLHVAEAPRWENGQTGNKCETLGGVIDVPFCESWRHRGVQQSTYSSFSPMWSNGAARGVGRDALFFLSPPPGACGPHRI